MDFFADYWTYHSCYSIPRSFALWSAQGLIGAITNRKLYYCIGDVEIHSNDYILLVGTQGFHKKTTCCDFARHFFEKACPDMPIGADNQSAEDICKNMSKDDFARVFKNERGESTELRAYAFYVNEFKDFITYAPSRMLNFLTNIYDRKVFKASTIARGVEDIIHPSLNILACENPDQLIGFMKHDIFTGGFSRRVIIVYEIDPAKAIPRPIITPEAREARKRVQQRCIEIRNIVGRFEWTSAGEKFFDSWYLENHKRLVSTTNPMLRGYIGTKDVHLCKTAMKLDVVSDKPLLVLSDTLLEEALAMLDSIEGNMPKLYASAGRNELAAPMEQAIDILERNRGLVPEKEFRRLLDPIMSPMEQLQCLRHFEDTGRAVKATLTLPNSEGRPVERICFITPKRYKELEEKRNQLAKQNAKPIAPLSPQV